MSDAGRAVPARLQPAGAAVSLLAHQTGDKGSGIVDVALGVEGAWREAYRP